jgi:acetyl-CoA carboxylase biotin carboxyl carrier protein
MTIDEIKELIRVAKESTIAEIELQRGEDRVRIRLAPFAADFAVAASGVMPVAAAVPAVAAPAPAEEEKLVHVKSPIVGTFYSAPSPESAVFVKPGDAVSPGKILCIIESMKLMNEIECEVSGTIVRCLVENGQPVEYGESLFAVRPN